MKLKEYTLVFALADGSRHKIPLSIPQGEDGVTPVKGKDYFDGKDGYTPIKGKDYFTEEDIKEIRKEINTEVSPLPPVSEGDNGKLLAVKDGKWTAGELTTDESLSYEGGVLSVNTAEGADPDNTLPITAAAVASTVGNIEILLKTI